MTKVHDDVEVLATIKVIGGDFCAPSCWAMSRRRGALSCLVWSKQLYLDSDSGLWKRCQSCIEAEEKQIAKEAQEENDA